MDFLKNFSIPTLGDDKDVLVEGLSIKAILNAIIEFVNKLIANEF